MSNKYWYGGKHVEEYDALFAIIDSMYITGKNIRHITRNLPYKWDSLVKAIETPPSLYKAEIKPDYLFIKSDELISHIDKIFILKENTDWGKN